jgi:hypothetical protein
LFWRVTISSPTPALWLSAIGRPALATVLAICTDDGGRARDGHRAAEVIVGSGVGALQLGDLIPAGRWYEGGLASAIESPDLGGIWAGTDERQRARMERASA